jgi:hemoglobin/transferrin/lactoferrin receptor protein
MKPVLLLAMVLPFPALAVDAAPPGDATVEPVVHQLDAIVVVASRGPEPLRQVVGTVSRVDRERMDRQGVQGIADLAALVPGLAVAGDAHRFGASGFNLRGLEGNRVSIEIDGVPLPEAFAVGQFASAGRDQVDLGAVDRVEILRGPASTLHGSKALAGVVSFHTPDPSEQPWEDSGAALRAQARMGVSSRDDAALGSARMALQGLDGRWHGLLLAGRRQGHQTANNPRSPADAANPADVRGDLLLAKSVLDAGHAGRWTATLEHAAGERQTDVQSLLFGPGRFATTYALLADDTQRRDRASVQAEWSPGGGWQALRLLAYGQDATVEQASEQYRLADRATPFASRRDRVFRYGQRSHGLGIEAQWRGRWGGVEHWQVFGVDIARHRHQGLRDGVETNLATGASTNVVLGEVLPVRDFPTSRTTELGLFWQDEMRFGDGWALVPGLRWERYRLDPRNDATWAADNPGTRPLALGNSAFTPKLGLRWQRGAFTAYLQHVRGFRAPPFADVNIGLYLPAFNYVALPNPDLKPERSRGLEAGLRWSNRELALSLAAYDNRYADLIDSRANLGSNADGQLVFQSVNRARARIHGFELEARWQLGERFPKAGGWYLDGHASWARGEDTVRGLPLNSVPPARATLAAGFESDAGDWGTELRLTGVRAVDRADQSTGALFLPPGYASLDANAWWRLHERLRLNLSLSNLGDRRQWDWSSLRGLAANAPDIDFHTRPGRAASLVATLDF